MFDINSIFGNSNYSFAILFAAIAFLAAIPAWRYIKREDAPINDSLEGSVTSNVISVRQSAGNFGMGMRRNYLRVSYEVAEQMFDTVIEVSGSTMRKYVRLLREKSKREKAGDDTKELSKDLTFDILYDTNDPTVIACEDTVRRFNNWGKLYVVVCVACVIAAVVSLFIPVN